MTQHDLFVRRPMRPAADNNRNLWELINEKERQKLLIPPFQREFVWKQFQVTEWAKSICSQDAIGVIVTYQIISDKTDDYPVWLLDGLQRLTATQYFIENPAKYGFLEFGPEQAEEYVKAFNIPVQHRHYLSHDMALKAFQRINLGTQVSPADYYRGELVKAKHGEYVYTKLVKVLEQSEARVCKGTQSSKHNRDCLALFYRFLMPELPHTSNVFSTVSRGTINPKSDKPIEAEIAKLVGTKTRDDIEKDLRLFTTFIQQQTAEIRTILTSVDKDGERAGISLGLYRHLLHVCIYRRNNGLSLNWLQSYIEGVLRASANKTTRINMEKDGKDISVTLKMTELNQLPRITSFLGLEMTKDRRKHQAKPLMPGVEHSHQTPFVSHGDGNTFGESGLRNRSRGAKSVEPDEIE
jgi:hypothetical protein